ncbi:uncharacterized protein LOC144650263 [Oculina patagonica]
MRQSCAELVSIVAPLAQTVARTINSSSDSEEFSEDEHEAALMRTPTVGLSIATPPVQSGKKTTRPQVGGKPQSHLSLLKNASMLHARRRKRSSRAPLLRFRNKLKIVQELGLQRAYSDNDAIYQYVRKTMAHQFLLHPETQPMFIRLEAQAQTDLLRKLVNYIRRQWIESQVFPR